MSSKIKQYNEIEPYCVGCKFLESHTIKARKDRNEAFESMKCTIAALEV